MGGGGGGGKRERGLIYIITILQLFSMLGGGKTQLGVVVGREGWGRKEKEVV